MKWTTESPKANGWYYHWYRPGCYDELIHVVLVVKHPFKNSYYYGSDIRHLDDKLLNFYFDDARHLWAGPIDEPEGVQNEVDN